MRILFSLLFDVWSPAQPSPPPVPVILQKKGDEDKAWDELKAADPKLMVYIERSRRAIKVQEALHATRHCSRWREVRRDTPP